MGEEVARKNRKDREEEDQLRAGPRGREGYKRIPTERRSAPGNKKT